MKRGKKLLTLLLVLVVLAGLTVLIPRLLPDEDAGSDDADNSFSILTLDADDITGISWDYSEALTFLRSGDSWVYADDSAFPLDESYLETMLSTLTQVTATKAIEEPEDLDQYGLEVPLCTVTVTAGESYTLSLGSETSLGGERYLSTGDGKVYLVDSTILDSFSYGLFDLLEYESIPNLYDTTGFHVESNSQSYDLVKLENSGIAYSDSYVWFLENGGRYLTLDTDLTEALIDNISTMTWGQCVTYNVSGDALAQYGLDDPTATITVNYSQTSEVETNETDEDGNPITETQETPATFVLEIGSEGTDGCYARIAGSNMVYLIDSAIRDDLCYTTYNDLRPDEVLLLDTTAITGLDILLNGETYHITRTDTEVTDEEGNISSETVFLLGETEVTVSGLLSTITGLDSTGYADTIPDATPEISFILYRDHETYPELSLAFYPYDSSSCLTVLGGNPTVFTAREDILSLIEDVNAIIGE